MPELRLDSFEVDDSNKFAVALCKAVVNLEKGYSPLYIHGEQGCGKTHLLTAVSTEMAMNHPEVPFLYISDDIPLEKVLSGEQSGPSNGGSDELIHKEYSQRDLLIVDDVERLSKDTKIRERFIALFDTFIDNGRQVLFASSFPIKDLRGFDKRFLSRLLGGVDASLSPPQPQTRLKILKRECERLGLPVDVDLLQLLMLEAGKDISYLKKLPAHLKTFATLDQQPLTKESVEEFIAIIREGAGADKTATTEQIYGSWVQSQAKKREADFEGTIQKLEQRLAEQAKQMQALKREVDAAHAREKSALVEAQNVKEQLNKKSNRLLSQEKLVSGEIDKLTKDLKKRDTLTEKLQTDYETELSERGSKILELEQLLATASDNLATSADEQKRAEIAARNAAAELERLKKDKDDEILALRIQLENKDESLKLLREEREARIGQQEKGKKELQEQLAEARSENLLLERAIEQTNSRIRELEEQLATKSRELKTAAERQAAATQQYTNLTAELEGLRSTLATTGEVASQVGQLQALLKARDEELITTRAQAERQDAEQEAQISSLGVKLKSAEERASEATSRLKSELEKKKNLEAELASAMASLEERKTSEAAARAELEHIHSEKESILTKASEGETRLQSEIQNLSRALAEERADRQSAERRTQELSNSVKALESQLNSTRADLEKASKKAQVLEEQAKKVSVERDTLKQKTQSLVGQATSLAETVERYEKTLKSKEEETGNLTAAIAELHEKLGEKENLLQRKEKEESDQVRKLAEELKARDEELMDLATDLAKRDSTLKKGSEHIENLNAEISELSRKLFTLKEEKEGTEKRLSDALEQLDARAKTADRENAAMQEKLDEAVSHAAELATDLEMAEADSVRKAEELKADFTEREKQLSDENASLNSKLREVSSQIEGHLAHISQLDERIRQQDELLTAKEKGESEHTLKLRDELERSNNQLEKTSTELNKRRLENELNIEGMAKLKTKLSDLEANLSALTTEKTRLEQQLSDVTSEAEDRLALAEKRNEETRKKIEEAESHASDLIAQLDAERASSAETLEKERAESAKREKEFIEAKTELEAALSAANSEINELKAHADGTRKRQEKQDLLVKDAARETSRLATLLEEKERRLAEIQLTVDSMRDDFLRKTAEGSEVKERFSSLEAELSAKDRALESMHKDSAELRSRLERLETDTQEQVRIIEEELKKSKQELASQLEQDKLLENRLSESQKEKSLIEQTLSERTNEFEKLAKEKGLALTSAEERTKEALKAAISSKDDEISRLKSDHKRESESLKSQVKEAMNEVARVRVESEKQLKLQREETEILKKKLTQIGTEMAKLHMERRAALAETPAEGSTKPDKDGTPAPPKPATQPQPESAPPVRRPAPIEWRHTFESFKVTEANAFTVNMAEKIAQTLAELYNPLCLYGVEKSGKTHMLHAIGKLASTAVPGLTAEIVSFDTLIRDIQASPSTYDRGLSKPGLLLIDDFDVANISAEDQLKFCDFLKVTLQKNIQVIITSKVPPIKMDYIQEYLLHFLENGLLAKLEPNPEVVKDAGAEAKAAAEMPTSPLAAAQEKEAEAEKPPAAAAGAQKDFLVEFLLPDSSLTTANYPGANVFKDFEETFRNPNKKWRVHFPLLVIEDDRKLRNHFFNALANRLRGVFTGPVSLLSVQKLIEMIRLAPNFNWNGLLNRLIKSHAILIDDCESVVKLNASASGYLRGIIEEIEGRDILLMIGTSKSYKKESVFGNVHKKASRKKL